MPIGVKFERKHKKLGYLAKYLYYCVAKRNILQKRMSFGQMNSDRVIYVIKTRLSRWRRRLTFVTL